MLKDAFPACCKPLPSSAKTPHPISVLIDQKQICELIYDIFHQLHCNMGRGVSLENFLLLSKESQRVLAGIRVFMGTVFVGKDST